MDPDRRGHGYQRDRNPLEEVKKLTPGAVQLGEDGKISTKYLPLPLRIFLTALPVSVRKKLSQSDRIVATKALAWPSGPPSDGAENMECGGNQLHLDTHGIKRK